MVPWPPHWQRSREAPDREREAGELLGAGEPKQTWRLCPVGADPRGQGRHGGPEAPSDPHNDPLPGKQQSCLMFSFPLRFYICGGWAIATTWLVILHP